jgi:hypothetical protein
MLRIFGSLLRLLAGLDLTGFFYGIDHDVGLPQHVRRAYNAAINEDKHNRWTSCVP